MSIEDTQPGKRTPVRPRKPAAPEHHPKHAAAEPEPGDPRIGTEVDPTATAIGYSDGSQYRCEDGVIAERIA
jgi:hypothetical protein